jgi:methionine aminopeptidase
MRDLSGHKISKYQIHAGKAVPNIYIDYPIFIIRITGNQIGMISFKPELIY